MIDTRKIRQGLQALIGLAVLCEAALLAQPFDWRVLVKGLLAGLLLLTTNPRLVPGLASAMPDSGSSAVNPANIPTKAGLLSLLLLVGVLLSSGAAYAQDMQFVMRADIPPGLGAGPVATTATITQVPAVVTAAPVDTGCKWKRVSPTVYRCGKLTLQPSFAAAAGQLNVKKAMEDGIANAYQRVSFLIGYGFTYHGDSVTMGGSFYGGAGIVTNQPNAPQANLLITFWDMLGIGPGLTTFKVDGNRVYQVLISLAVNYSAGGTTAKILPLIDEIISTCVEGYACPVPGQ